MSRLRGSAALYRVAQDERDASDSEGVPVSPVDLANEVRAARHVYVIGNGGSFANAAHMVNDLLAKGVRAYAMDAATLTAFANDCGYEWVFERWLAVVGEAGDLLIALSGSGRSPNILRACERAEAMGMRVERVFGAAAGLGMQAAEEEQLRLGHRLHDAL